MNFLTSIIRKATRTSGDTVNVLVLVSKIDNPNILEDTEQITFYKSVLPSVEYDIVISDEQNLQAATQFAMSNHLLLLKSLVLDESEYRNIIVSAAKLPYLGHQ